MNNNIETFPSSSQGMGRKSQLQSRLKNPTSFQALKKEEQDFLSDLIIQQQILRNAQKKSRNPAIELRKFKIPFAHDPEDDEKIAELEEIIARNDAIDADYLNLAVLYLQLDMRKKFMRLWPRLCKKFPKAPFLPFLTGFDNFMYVKHNDDVKELFDQAIIEGYSSALLYVTYGNVFARQQNKDAARKMYQKAIEIDPNFHVSWLNLGVLDFQEMAYDKAEKNFLHSLFVNWKYFKAYTMLYTFSTVLSLPLQVLKHNEPDFTKFLFISLLFAPYLDEVKSAIDKMEMRVDQLERDLRMSMDERSEWKLQLQQIWQPYYNQSFEQVWKEKKKLYRELAKFGERIEDFLKEEIIP